MLPVLLAATADWSVAVAVAVVATVILIGLAAALVSVVRASRALRQAAEDLSRQSERLLAELGGTIRDANAELERVDVLVDSAEDLTETLTAASHAAYLTVARPLIKVLALRRGTARAAQYWWSGRVPARRRQAKAGRQPSRREASGHPEVGPGRLALPGVRRTPERSPHPAGERLPSGERSPNGGRFSDGGRVPGADSPGPATGRRARKGQRRPTGTGRR